MSNNPPSYSLRQLVDIKVTGQRGFITSVQTTDLCTPLYLVLHLDRNQQRTQTWLPETEIEASPANATLPFPNPFSTASSST